MAKKAKAVGINHVALEVGNIEEALEFYGRFLDFELHRKSEMLHSFTLATSLSILQKGANKVRMTSGISASPSTIRNWFARHWPRWVSHSSTAGSWIF
ncbi:MAG: VOC family protein [Pseudomonadota bacterium]|nr:VOC family protein [Pseudomonadota bacterium]